jgi:hypothetical protein
VLQLEETAIATATSAKIPAKQMPTNSTTLAASEEADPDGNKDEEVVDDDDDDDNDDEEEEEGEENDQGRDEEGGKEEDASVYDLYGVVNHVGGMFGGHYTAFVHCEVSPTLPPLPPSSSSSSRPTVATSTSTPAAMHDDVRGSSNSLEDAMRSMFSGMLTEHEIQESSISLHEYLRHQSSPSHPDSHPNHSDNHPKIKDGARPSTLTHSNEYDQESQRRHAFGHAPAPKELRWMRFDDDLIGELQPIRLENDETGVSEEFYEPVIVSESAYLLFYRKRYLSPDNLMRYS